MLRFAQFRLLQAFREHHSLTVSPPARQSMMRFFHSSKLAACFNSVACILTPPSCLLYMSRGILDYSRKFLKIPGTLCRTPRTLSHIPVAFGRYGLFTVYHLNTTAKDLSAAMSQALSLPDWGGGYGWQRE